MPRKDQGWITFQTTAEERQLLEEICQTSQRTKTEVLRELLRGLRDENSIQGDEPDSLPSCSAQTVQRSRSLKGRPTHRSQPPNQSSLSRSPKPLKVSSRNILEGRVKQIIKGPVITEVTLAIGHEIELISTITTTSAEALELQVGKPAYVVIKSSDVVIAME